MTENNRHAPVASSSMKWISYYYKGIILLFIIVIAFTFGYQRGKEKIPAQVPLKSVVLENKDNKDLKVDFSLFWDVWDLLKDKYVDTGNLDAQKLVYGAIKGMLAATGDPYTNFLDPQENKEFSQDITGSFEGIGAELGVKNGILTVIAPLEGTPAEKAGLRSGDKIIKINGKTTSDMSIEDAVTNIRGQKGTQVTLTIFRNGDQETKDIVVQRDTVNVKSVTYETKGDNIAYIKISRFGDDTTKGFRDSIQKAAQRKVRGIIIDLRNNPGGYLESSIDVASTMLAKNNVVVIEESGDKTQKKMYTRGGDVASGINTVVLINEGSASASEILAGALKDNRQNVTIVGKKSFGKGSVQEFIELPGNTATKITVARWLTPSGKQINEEGIHPDVEIDMTNDDFNNDRDPQLDKAIELVNEKAAK